MFQRIILCLILCISTQIDAQKTVGDSALTLRPHVVIGFQEQTPKESSLNISSLSSKSIQESGNYNLSQALTALPGVNQLSTGIGISKPVIRGLYGNRVLVLLSSLKFDNQQWQDEHGLGLSDLGILRVELIKGPASVIYGTDAVGGVINVVEDNQLEQEGWKGEFRNRTYSNTLGTINSLAFKGKKGNKNWRILAGAENSADYSDGHYQRVLNSRFDGYYLKGNIRFVRKNWTSENSYNASLNHFGFILNDLKDFFAPDARWSRSMAGPHHSVLLNCLASQNTIQLKHSFLKLNLGLQSNLRMEDEGGGSISLNMHLVSLPYSIQWHKEISSRTRFILSDVGNTISNTNYGGRIIIPDASMNENGLSAFIRHQAKKWLSAELGIGANIRNIKTFETGMLNTADKEVRPFNSTRKSANGLAGLIFTFSDSWTFRLNASNGFRSPNLAELSSNGLHEGIFRYEIGNPSLKNEYNINLESGTQIETKHLRFSASIFRNAFQNYIYLAPTSENIFGFQVFRYKQGNAILTGGEIQCSVIPFTTKVIEVQSAFSTVTGRLHSSSYLPYIPANKWSNTLLWSLSRTGKRMQFHGSLGIDYVFAQKTPSENETSTPAYSLWNCSFNLDRKLKNNSTLSFYLRCNNLLNTYYVDHLSRFKAYGIYNQGRNIIFGTSIPIH